MLTRLRRNDAGFGLIELIMALTVLNIGILATVAALNSGAIALQRASKVSTATAIADAQMEKYRALEFEAIMLVDSLVSSTDSAYANDSAIGGDRSRNCRTDGTSFLTCADTTPDAGDATPAEVCTGSPAPTECTPSRTVTGPDRRQYRVDVYIVSDTPTAASRPLKSVTVVVRDGRDHGKTYVRAQSTFDESTGT